MVKKPELKLESKMKFFEQIKEAIRKQANKQCCSSKFNLKSANGKGLAVFYNNKRRLLMVATLSILFRGTVVLMLLAKR